VPAQIVGPERLGVEPTGRPAEGRHSEAVEDRHHRIVRLIYGSSIGGRQGLFLGMPLQRARSIEFELASTVRLAESDTACRGPTGRAASTRRQYAYSMRSFVEWLGAARCAISRQPTLSCSLLNGKQSS
jgi:hypothetical protein